MSRRDDDGGDTTTSGDDEFSVEDEFRDWAEEAGSGPQDEPETAKSGWMGRVFGRKSADRDVADDPGAPPSLPSEPDPESDPAVPAVSTPDATASDLDDPAPEQLGVFRAINVEDGPPTEVREALEPVDEVAAPSEPEIERAAGIEGDEGDAEVLAEVAEEQPAPTGAAGAPSFADLWGSQAEDSSDDIVDFAEFTSEDYLAATTREYAGLAEAVARAEEEETEQIAVAAEIPGLESGIVGLEDVVSAETGGATSDVIEPPSSSDLPMRVLTALGLLALTGASLLSPYGIGALIFVVLFIAAGEMFAALIRAGYRPLSIFGFLGVAGSFAGTWAAGPVAIPIALLLTAVAVFLFYATVPGRRAALENASLTIMVTAWIGGLGGFAFDFLGSDDYVWLVVALIVTVAAMDIGQYFVGRRIGRRQLAPVVSP
ncbi:MAG: phosphatidate cytidylyltransferase, partial [Acidimicrobiia bacterium]|nr:phosphatidate cytidylyltransferase [Acidimicrobiia bacterium]